MLGSNPLVFQQPSVDPGNVAVVHGVQNWIREGTPYHSVALLVQGGCLNAPYVSSHRAYIKTSEVHLEARNRTEPWFGEVW